MAIKVNEINLDFDNREDNPDKIKATANLDENQKLPASLINDIKQNFNSLLTQTSLLTGQSEIADYPNWLNDSLEGTTISSANQPYTFTSVSENSVLSVYQLGADPSTRADVTFPTNFNGAGGARETLTATGQLVFLGSEAAIEDNYILSFPDGGDVCFDHKLIPVGKIRYCVNAQASQNNPYAFGERLRIRNGLGSGNVITNGANGGIFVDVEPSQTFLLGYAGPTNEDLLLLYYEDAIFDWTSPPANQLRYSATHIFKFTTATTVVVENATFALFGKEFVGVNEGTADVTIQSAQLSSDLILRPSNKTEWRNLRASGMKTLTVHNTRNSVFTTQVETLTYAATTAESTAKTANVSEYTGGNYTHDGTEGTATDEVSLGNIYITRHYIGNGMAEVELEGIVDNWRTDDSVTVSLPTGYLADFRWGDADRNVDNSQSRHLVLLGSVDTITLDRRNNLDGNSPFVWRASGCGKWVGQWPE